MGTGQALLLSALVVSRHYYGAIINTDRQAHGAVAMTDCGRVQGEWVANGSAYVFRGIPYAEPPVGQLRWQPPIPISPNSSNCWNGTLVATTFASPCYQRVESYYGPTITVGSEDCLYLNIWTPNLNPDVPLHVMFSIHGGFLLVGNGNEQDIGNAPSAKNAHDKNVVFVSLNYRLQAFGFMALDWLREKSPHNTSGNYGFIDQLAALQWVQRNIQSFGGDPNQVTVYGQSTGGTSIFALLGSPLSTGLFHKAWLLSALPRLNTTATKAFKDNEVFIKRTNCSDVDCLYNLSAEGVTTSVPWDVYPYWQTEGQKGLPTKGRYEGAIAIIDGYVLPESPFDAWVNHRGMDVNLMIGTDGLETSLYPDTSPSNSDNWTWYEQYIHDTLGSFKYDLPDYVLTRYPAEEGTPEKQIVTRISDIRVTCGNDFLSLIAAFNFRNPVYRYVTSYFDSIAKDDEAFEMFGTHGVDLFGFYGRMDSLVGKRAQSDIDWEENIQREILSFVKDGRPSSTEWKPYPKKTALLNVKTTMVDSYLAEQCTFWNEHASELFSYNVSRNVHA